MRVSKAYLWTGVLITSEEELPAPLLAVLDEHETEEEIGYKFDGLIFHFFHQRDKLKGFGFTHFTIEDEYKVLPINIEEQTKKLIDEREKVIQFFQKWNMGPPQTYAHTDHY